MNKKFTIIACLITSLIVGTVTYGATVFNSSQVGNSPVNGYYLKTNGTVSTWAAVTGGSSGGGIGWASSTEDLLIYNTDGSDSNPYTVLIQNSGVTATTSTGKIFEVIGDSEFDQASTTILSADTICLTGDTCETTWPTGGGSGSVSTSTSPTIGNLAYWTSKDAWPETLGSVATTTLGVGASISNTGTLGYQIGGSNSVLSLNMANPNTWTGLQTLTNASTTGIHTINELCFTTGQCMSAPSISGSLISLFHHNDTSEFVGYEQLRTFPPTGTEVDESCTADADTAGGYCDIEVGGYISTTTDLILDSLPSGTWDFRKYVYTSNVAGQNKIESNVYKRDAAGTETYLFQATSTDFNLTSVGIQEYSIAASAYSFLPTDRIVIKVRGWTDSSAGRLIHMVYGATNHYSRIITPITLANFDYAIKSANETISGDWTHTGKLTLGNASSTLLSSSYASSTTICLGGECKTTWPTSGSASLSYPLSSNYFIGTSTATSTYSGGIEAGTKIAAPYFIATSTTATSTFAGAINTPNLNITEKLGDDIVVDGGFAVATQYTAATAGVDIVLNTITLSSDPGWSVNDTVWYSGGGGTVMAGLVASSTYFIASNAAGVITVKTTIGGSAVNITGTGNNAQYFVKTNWFTGSSSGVTGGVTGWNLNAGVAQHFSGTLSLVPAVALVPIQGVTYKITYTVSNWSVAGTAITFGGVTAQASTFPNADGVYNVYVTAATTASLIITPITGGLFSIDDISIKPVFSGIEVGGATPLFANRTLDDSDSTETAFRLNYTTNKSVGNDYGLIINRTDVSSAGSSYLLDLQDNGASQLSVDVSGTLVVTAGGSFSGSITSSQNISGYAPTTGLYNSTSGTAIVGTGFEMSPSLSFTGEAWNTTTSASETNTMDIFLLPTGGINPTSAKLIFSNRMIDDVANTTELMTLMSSGNFGVGTTTPYSLLSVQATAGGSTPLFTIASSTSGAATSTYLTVLDNGKVGIGTVNPVGLLDVNGKLTVLSSGNVGIGTSSPFNALSNTSYNILDQSGVGTIGSGGSGISWRSNAAGYGIGLVNDSTASNAMGLLVRTAGVASTNKILTLNSGGTDRLTVLGNGSIGIATTTPSASYKLDVYGQARIDGTDTATSTIRGNILFTGQNQATGCYFVYGATAGATTTINCY